MIKKKLMKAAALLLAAAAFLAVFAGCAGDNGAVTGDTQNNDTTAAAQDVTEPDTTAAETDGPGTEQTTAEPETETTAEPETEPVTSDPETTAPETTEPETTAPETTVPETTAPETTVPETTAPETTARETTAPETTAPEPPKPTETLTVIDATDAAHSKLADYFKNGSYCKVSMTPEGLRLTADGAKTLNVFTPCTYFAFNEYASSVGMLPPDLKKLPYIVMKVKADPMHDRTPSVSAAVAVKGTESAKASSFIPGYDEWYYIGFDFSKINVNSGMVLLKITPETTVGSNGEGMTIAEIRFCTGSEGEKLITGDVYPTARDGADLKVMQFNVQTENGNSAPFVVKAEMYRRLVDELKPDVVGMQEVTVTWRKWLDSYVFNASYEGVGEPRTNGGEANPIYYRKDKFELVDSGTIWLSDTPDVKGSALEGVNYPRICTWVILRDRATGKQFAHMNTHLDHNGNNDSTTGNNIRKAQMRVIIKYAQKFNGMPLFLTGDLNNRRTTSKNKTYALIQMIEGTTEVKDDDGNVYGISLSDARLHAEKTVADDHIATMTKYFDENSTSYEPTREPIDYVFYDDTVLKALEYDTFLISNGDYWISDHLPLFTAFDFR